MTKLEQFQGCLVGGAIGDALGAPVEFMMLPAIRQIYGADGITSFDYAYGRKGAITDDTQMTMFTVDALIEFWSYRAAPLEILLTQAYLYWLTGQERDFDATVGGSKLLQNPELWSPRAPGMTCLGSLRQIRVHGKTINNTNKGCGGVMRVAPIGLAVKDPDEAYCAGKMCALITHHHNDGFIPAGALARIISLMVHQEMSFWEAQYNSFEFVDKEESTCGTIELWSKAQDFNASDSHFSQEHLSDLGEGWAGDEALAMSVYCALKADNFMEAVINAVNHSGDSDSTGSITGQILGAEKGVQSLPVLLMDELELCGVLMEQAQQLYGLING